MSQQPQKRKTKRNLPSGGSSVIPPLSSEPKVEKISKYFTKPQPELTVDSPFRNTLSDIEQNVTHSDDSDFRTPETKSKRLKPFQEQKTKNPPKKRLRQKKISSLIKSVEENFSYENVNSEHLQMALALSKSVTESVEVDNGDEVYNAVYNSTQERISGMRRTLEEFGFKSGRSRLPGVYQKTSDANKKRKKSKFQYVTPILFLRTEEDRQKIIASKISLILSEKLETKPQNCLKKTTDGVCSEYLQNFCTKESNILQLNSLEVEELTSEKLYIKNLNLSPSKVKCGSLLKDWRLIPGRETTPVRDISKSCDENVSARLQEVNEKEESALSALDESLQEKTTEALIQESGIVIPQKQRSISPDLFESDDEVNKSFRESNFESTNDSQNLSVVAKNSQIPKESESFASFCDKFQSVQDLCVVDSEKTAFDSGISEVIQEKERTTVSTLSQQKEAVSCTKMASNYESTVERANANCKDDIPEISLHSFKSTSQERRCNFSFDDKDEVIENEKGILHFESFCKESELLSQEYVDLTQSSDEENETKTQDNEVQDEINVSFGSEDGLRKTTEDLDLSQETATQKVEKNGSSNNESKEILTGTEKDVEDSSPQKSIHNQTEHLNNYSSTPVITFEESFRRESLNITDYIHNILNQNETNDLCASDDEIVALTEDIPEKQQTFAKYSSFSSVASTCSQESIYISDEELNYSSVQANTKEISSSDCSEKNVCAVDDDLDFSPKTPETEEDCAAVRTPSTEFIVRTTNVTPMPDFDRMDTPKVTEELKKFGVKAMKRKRGVQLLKYIYDATHPFVGENMEFDDEQIVKKRKIAQDDTDKSCCVEIVGDIINENELEDLIFEKRQSTRIHSCRLPLQIAFFNSLSCNPEIRKKILLYEPLQLEELHSMLKNQGFKYHIKDLLTFLDRKCITVRTNHK